MAENDNWTHGTVANGHILLDGEGWVPLAEYERRQGGRQAQTALAAPPAPQAIPGSGSARPIPVKPAWYRRSWVVGVAAGAVGLVLGAAVGSADPTESTEYAAQAKELAAVESQLKDAQSGLEETTADLEDARAEVERIQGDLPDREAALKTATTQLAKDRKRLDGRESAVTAKEKSVAAREKAVGIVERQVEANTISGGGIYEVGVDMKAGTYKSNGGSGMCYYAENGDANGNNILSNNIVDGGAPAVTSVSAGHFFETSGCGDWVLQP